MLNVHNLSVSFSGEFLFENISFKLTPGNRVGLIGKNGAGKSTLLKILSGEQEYDTGDMAKDKHVTIGYLKQDIDFVDGNTILEEAYQAFTKLKRIEFELEQLNLEIADRSDYESKAYQELLENVSTLQEQYEIHGGYTYKGDTEKVLQGLGFQREDFDKKTETFSGGWRMRIELAKLLLQQNDILLLDEPTNHLDIESIIWLESFLQKFSGAVLLVSHDKMFLDNVTNRTIEISLGRLYDYNKPYSKFLELRKEQREQQLAAQKNQQKHIEHTEKLIEKFRAKANKATMAQSLIKKLDKIDRIEVDEQDNAVMSLSFPVSVNPGKVIVELEQLSKSYGDKKVLSNVDLLLERNSKTAFVGQNGQGKSTLAKIIVDEISYEGHLKLGHNVQIGYFAQNQAEYLDGNITVEETMINAADEKTRTKVRDILGAFLFRGDDVDKKVKVLSGGERNRLALAKMILQPFNVLVMDEPTNHLDIASKNVLKEALKRFEGTLILISHDRDFLQGLTNKVFEFKNHQIKEYLGDIDDYLKERNLEDLRDVEKRQKTATTPAPTTKKLAYEEQKKLKAVKNKLSKVEANINKLEREIAAIDKQLAEDYEAMTAQPDFFDNYQKKKDELEALMEQWEELQEQIDVLS